MKKFIKKLVLAVGYLGLCCLSISVQVGEVGLIFLGIIGAGVLSIIIES